MSYYGSIQAVTEEYFNQVEAAVELAAQLPTGKRLGHIGLIEKFSLTYPETCKSLIDQRLRRILPKLQASKVGIDVNTAGFRKATCRKAYAPDWFIHEGLDRGIQCVFGSDAHEPNQVGVDWDWFENTVKKYAL